jgi:hypothetical protein
MRSEIGCQLNAVWGGVGDGGDDDLVLREEQTGRDHDAVWGTGRKCFESEVPRQFRLISERVCVGGRG